MTTITVSTKKKVQRRLATQRRLRTTVNTIHNLVDNLVETLLSRSEPIPVEDSQKLGRISAVLTAIQENQGQIRSQDLHQFLEQQTQELSEFLSDT